MDELRVFILAHWQLAALAGILLLTIIVTEAMTYLNGVKQLKISDAVLMINRENATIIDVRPTEKYAQGHILGAQNVPMDMLEQFAQSARSGPIIVVCQVGRSSQIAIAALDKLGVKNLYNLEGGVTAWASEGFPLSKQG